MVVTIRRNVRFFPLLVMVLVAGVGRRSGPDPVSADLLQNLHSGVRMAGKLFGIDTISDVADLVAKGFSRQGYFMKPEANNSMQQQAASMLVMVWKLLGLDGSKLGALVMNALIFVAHVIATNLGTLDKPSPELPNRDPSKPLEEAPAGSSILQSESPLLWLLNNPPKQFRTLMESVRDGNLTDYLEADLGNLDETVPEDTDCIRLLVCKIKPFIWKMQSVVRDRLLNKDGVYEPPELENLAGIVFKVVPSLEEFRANGERCESQFRHCDRRL
ncbi:uncharacterized protein LOC120415746 [Culex pipiens pallens]|uniref:uncharacterized protein LOC120415746 n=1 Tax=Culex pipiens pallens TaxID=42434 RepID=UPI0019535F18|nr:uncharacterized protein LOC120415746 [Culex pipiens pallens]